MTSEEGQMVPEAAGGLKLGSTSHDGAVTTRGALRGTFLHAHSIAKRAGPRETPACHRELAAWELGFLCPVLAPRLTLTLTPFTCDGGVPSGVAVLFSK